MDVTYADKDKEQTDGVRNAWRDVDANEVKTAVNSKQDAPPSGKYPVVDCGDYNASTVQFPTGGGTGPSGALVVGNEFTIITGSVNPELVPVGATIRYRGVGIWRVYY